MRHFFTTALLVASLSGSVFGHRHSSSSPHDDTPIKRRKTLGFGPAHPQSVYHATPYSIQTNGFTPMDPSMDPMDVARLFVDDVLAVSSSDGNSYKIRDDSYTDKTTGVTHVYVRQVVNGLEVVDGDMNINIKDGMVISYGNSFFKGNAPTAGAVTPSRDPRLEACSTAHGLLNTFAAPQSEGQVVMGAARPERVPSEVIDAVNHNCQTAFAPPAFSSDDPQDFRPALLHFMHTATPNTQLSADIEANFDEYVAKMEPTSVHHFAPEGNGHSIEFHVANVPDTVNPVKAKPAYHQVPNAAGDGTDLELVWRFEVEMQDNWYEASVTAHAPHKIVSVVDWASDSVIPVPKPPSDPVQGSYNVFAWGVNDPSVGERTIEKENFDALASPAGWHAIPYSLDPQSAGIRRKPKEFWRNTTTTWGNNVFAQENWEGANSYVENYRPDSADKVFDYPYNPKETEKVDGLDEAKKYINATVAQLFYTNNLIHDLFYRYGFTEEAGNFQQYNFGRGGREGDGVIANAQDGSGYNNANFMTPPDGQNGRMRMYLWNTALPFRDGDLEAGIVIHEYSHGLSTRLTGGPLNSGCLGWGESGGMGEGWGDFLATTIRANKVYSDYAMGSWAANREKGIRNFVYSLDTAVNPSTYKTLDKPGYWGVHAIGEVWAEILWVVSQRLIEQHGYSDALFPPLPLEDGTVPAGDFYRTASEGKPLVPKHGNTLSVQLVINGMKLQPCRPTFFQARDAIIAADQVLTGGENFCTLWKGFAERGLGADAKIEGQTPWGGGVRTNGFTVPSACRD